MPEWALQGLWILLGAVLTAVGFIVRRLVTKASKHESATLYTLLADLKGKMAEQGVSVSDLDEFAAQLSPKMRERTQILSGRPMLSPSTIGRRER